jgi:hypothetical protein
MEPILVAAYREMLKAHPGACSVDRILEDPRMRDEFLNRVWPALSDRTEFDVLHTLNNLRKRSKLPRRAPQRPADSPMPAKSAEVTIRSDDL